MLVAEIIRCTESIFRAAPTVDVLFVDGVFLIALVAIARRLSQMIPVYVIFILPGTIAHELAHWSVAIITNGKPALPQLLPKRTTGGLMLGHVVFKNTRWYNTPFIALAPLLLVPIVAWLYLHETARIPLRQLWHWISLYLVAAMGFSALPSKVDVRLAWKYGSSIPLMAMAGALAIWLWRH